jgi:hypothetical protein
MRFHIFRLLIVLIAGTAFVTAAPPRPQQFVANQAERSKELLLQDVQVNLSENVGRVVTVWRQGHPDPLRQIQQLLQLTDRLTQAPARPKLMLRHPDLRLTDLFETRPIYRALDRFESQSERSYRALFKYFGILSRTISGNPDHAYNQMCDEIEMLMQRYLELVKAFNHAYGKEVLPYYTLKTTQRKAP